jgi:hypothetical protein
LGQKASPLGIELVPVDRLRSSQVIESIDNLGWTYKIEADAADGSGRFAGDAGHGAVKQ